ncbi:MAG: MSMEG_1061 family FMN-dependent PPOX-type flavoprotein [Pseudomonadota bacterium]
MTAKDPITSVEGIRDIIGEPHPLVEKKIIDTLDAVGKRYIIASPFAMLSTVDSDGLPDVSPRGDASGQFIHIVDDGTLLMPERPGNKLAFSLQNIVDNGKVALIFMIPGVIETYRVHGSAQIVKDPDILQQLEARGMPALMAVEIKIRRCFLHCGKAVMRSSLWKTESQAGKLAFKFGETIAREAGEGKELEEAVNQLVAEDYRDNL